MSTKRNAVAWRARALVLVAATVLLPAAARAAGAPPPSAADGYHWGDLTNQRALNGHYFLPSQVVPDPFTSTHFGSSLAFGYGRIDATIQNNDGTTQDVQLKVLATQQGLDLQVGMGSAGPASFALRVRAAASAIVGINADSALYYPLSLGYEYGVGFVAKPWGNRYFQFALALDFQRGTTYRVSPLTALQNSLNQGGLTSSGLLSKSNTTDLAPGLSLAVSPYKVIGLMSSLRYVWEHVDGGATDHLLDWGLALSLDLNTVLSVPIGLQGVYELVKTYGASTTLQHYGGGGLWYTGRKDLALGVEVVATKSNSGGVDQLLIQGQFRLRYYW
jgi:hypothetical protein